MSDVHWRKPTKTNKWYLVGFKAAGSADHIVVCSQLLENLLNETEDYHLWQTHDQHSSSYQTTCAIQDLRTALTSVEGYEDTPCKDRVFWLVNAKKNKYIINYHHSTRKWRDCFRLARMMLHNMFSSCLNVSTKENLHSAPPCSRLDRRLQEEKCISHREKHEARRTHSPCSASIWQGSKLQRMVCPVAGWARTRRTWKELVFAGEGMHRKWKRH